MGMDVYGRRPSAPAGRYFRSALWAWPPIHALLWTLCGDLLPGEMFDGMAVNQGAGPRSQAVCTKMAERFATWLRSHPKGFKLTRSQRRLQRAVLLSSLNPHAKGIDVLVMSKGRAVWVSKGGRGHLWMWVKFLRHCGGFEVR